MKEHVRSGGIIPFNVWVCVCVTLSSCRVYMCYVCLQIDFLNTTGCAVIVFGQVGFIVPTATAKGAERSDGIEGLGVALLRWLLRRGAHGAGVRVTTAEAAVRITGVGGVTTTDSVMVAVRGVKAVVAGRARGRAGLEKGAGRGRIVGHFAERRFRRCRAVDHAVAQGSRVMLRLLLRMDLLIQDVAGGEGHCFIGRCRHQDGLGIGGFLLLMRQQFRILRDP